MNAYWWMVRRFGLLTTWRYNRERRRRERVAGVKFDARVDGEAMLRGKAKKP